MSIDSYHYYSSLDKKLFGFLTIIYQTVFTNIVQLTARPVSRHHHTESRKVARLSFCDNLQH